MKRAWQFFSTWKWPPEEETSVAPQDPRASVPEGAVRFVCLSDTHNLADRMLGSIPDGDVMLHTGDFTNFGFAENVDKFNKFLGKLPHKYKVVIAGNHDLSFDDYMVRNCRSTLHQKGLTNERLEQFLTRRNLRSVKELMTNCLYLEDTMVDIFGIKIYGSPWSHGTLPIPGFVNAWLPAKNVWAFNAACADGVRAKWNKIPGNVDILMTHGPPLGHGDRFYLEYNCGCADLLDTIQNRVKPAYHVFGHMHEGYGVTTDGCTTYVNAANCNIGTRIANPPIVFDIPLPEGRSKQETAVPVYPVRRPRNSSI